MTHRMPIPPLTHLARLASRAGVCEHALLSQPRPELGFCTDDAGRTLAVVCAYDEDPAAEPLARTALTFLAGARTGDGGFRLRARSDGTWTDDDPSDDASGRALLGLGVAAATAPWPEVRRLSRRLFESGTGITSPHPRARAYAAIGAAAVLKQEPDHSGALHLADKAVDLLDGVESGTDWYWPETRLSYDNARIPEAVLAVAGPLGRPHLAERALDVLTWLVMTESIDGHFSFTPVGGRGPGDVQPAFDQQPIEAWAMAEACTRAFRHTGDRWWRRQAVSAARWFLGDNDVGIPVGDPRTGGGYDGLESAGVNANQGAESTLAYLGALSCVGHLTTDQTGGRPKRVRESSR